MSEDSANSNTPFEWLKSALVIPLVVAIVLAAGGGLAQLGRRDSERSGKPDPRPAEQRPDGSLELSLAFAQLNGELDLNTVHGKRAITDWKNAGDFASCRFPIESPGPYMVQLDLSCPPGHEGSTLAVQLAGTSHDVTVPETGGGGQNSKTVAAGEFQIPSAGWHELKIVLRTIAGGPGIALRGVRLVPKKP